MSVLPVHSMLRLLAQLNKAFIVGERHAYDPYMQMLLGRLPNLLGMFGAPVVLLSVTLPVSVNNRLIKEVSARAGMKSSQLRGRQFPAPYPRWLHGDAGSGAPTAVSLMRHRGGLLHRMDVLLRGETVAAGAQHGTRSR
jgi:CRISPR-associated endonuclease/helicase Cas3